MVLNLKSYEFKKYKSKKDSKKILLTVVGNKKPSSQSQLNFKALEEGTFFLLEI